MNRKEAEMVLEKKFHIPAFYDEQWQAIEKILKGERVLLIQKTGFGKSLCFQFPAITFENMTIVFSPLIALMRDQCTKLTSLGIIAKCINSEQTTEENQQILEESKAGKIKILYITPERQENQNWIDEIMTIKISMIVIDEAHCISMWGHDFRPAFKKIINIIKQLPKSTPVLATTATATKTVEKDIAQQMGNAITIIRGNLMRENLKLFVIQVNSEDEKFMSVARILEQFNKKSDEIKGSGIIYTGRKADAEEYAHWLSYINIPTIHYHADVEKDKKKEIEAGLMENKWKCIVSTNALGMGIDKPDIRLIIHTQMPASLIHYYQEIGRAGRNGEKAFIFLLYYPEDRDLPQSFIDNAQPSIEKYNKVIEAVKQELLNERELIKSTNLKQTVIRTIKAELIDQRIIREIRNGTTKQYEYIRDAPKLNTNKFKELREIKIKQLDKMEEYIKTEGSRMQFLCNYLGDDSNSSFINCDNTREKKINATTSDDWKEKLKTFRENYFPELQVAFKGSKMMNGVASSYYGRSMVGQALSHSKYKNGGDFPDWLIELTIKAFHKKFEHIPFDLILYVPPTTSGDLVKNFAIKISNKLNIPISHDLIKTKITKEQKFFENSYGKKDNIQGAFHYTQPEKIKNKNILLIDDICDSNATIKEIGKLLTQLGVAMVAPLVIAKTVGGDHI